MNTVLEGQDDHASAYIDVVVVYSNTWDEQLGYIEEVLAVLRRFGLTAKSVKCQWGAKSLIYLGHEVGRGKVSVPAVKVKAIRGVARILLKGVLNLVSLTRPLFLLLVGCIVLTSLATLSAFSLET